MAGALAHNWQDCFCVARHSVTIQEISTIDCEVLLDDRAINRLLALKTQAPELLNNFAKAQHRIRRALLGYSYTVH